MSVADVSVGSEESGPGVLARLKFQTTQGATEGIQHLLLDPDQAAHIDALNNPYPADTLNHAIAAIDTACPSTQPPPSSPPTLAPPPPFTTPTITPMATPVPLPPGEGGMDAMSIDMNPHDTPANTATSIGSREFCARINANDLLDADEVDVDILEIDVTTGPEGIPETNPMIALSFTLLFEEGQIRVIGNDVRMLLDAEPFGSVLDASELLPDSDGQFGVTALDINTDVTESGPGVLSRIRIEPTVDTLPGIHYLLLDGAVHIDIAGAARVPETLNHAVVAIGVDCPSVQPPPPAPPRPDNDDFASAKALTIPTGRPSRNIEGEYGYFNTTASATSETGKPLLCEEIGKTVWYAFTSTEDGETIFDMQSTAFGPVVAVYTGDDLESLALVSCAPINREASEVSINTVAGETYFVQIGGRDGATGNVVFAYWSEPDATSTPTSSPSPTVTPTALLPTATACICDPLIRGIGGAGPAALPATGGTPQANSDGPITALGIAGLGIVAAAAWAIAHALRRS